MYEDGAADVEVCKSLRITYSQFDTRYKDDVIFQQLVDYGRLAAKSWWHELGRKGARGEKNFNYNAWYAYMKNQYGWSDKAEVKGFEKPIDQMSKDEITQEVARRKNQIATLLNPSNVALAIMNLHEPVEETN